MTGLDGAVGASSAFDGQRAGSSHTGNGRVRLLHNALVSTLVTRMSLLGTFRKSRSVSERSGHRGTGEMLIPRARRDAIETRLGHSLPLANG